MNRSWVRFTLIVAFLAAVAGCGQKGPLYLPDDGGLDAAPAAEADESTQATS
jgi:predicted small lipoprotein YifL